MHGLVRRSRRCGVLLIALVGAWRPLRAAGLRILRLHGCRRCGDRSGVCTGSAISGGLVAGRRRTRGTEARLVAAALLRDAVGPTLDKHAEAVGETPRGRSNALDAPELRLVSPLRFLRARTGGLRIAPASGGPALELPALHRGGLQQVAGRALPLLGALRLRAQQLPLVLQLLSGGALRAELALEALRLALRGLGRQARLGLLPLEALGARLRPLEPALQLLELLCRLRAAGLRALQLAAVPLLGGLQGGSALHLRRQLDLHPVVLLDERVVRSSQLLQLPPLGPQLRRLRQLLLARLLRGGAPEALVLQGSARPPQLLRQQLHARALLVQSPPGQQQLAGDLGLALLLLHEQAVGKAIRRRAALQRRRRRRRGQRQGDVQGQPLSVAILQMDVWRRVSRPKVQSELDP
mmetsp:Transcript_101643/g.313631  ORF Transcript_101643/g.313631 Transcript_101643/m.313631 type:complete len:410 (-) Transcript_101643:388-1617(-)